MLRLLKKLRSGKATSEQPPRPAIKIPQTPEENYLQAMKIVADVLGKEKLKYAVYGSGACFLHGAKFTESQLPGDIDVTLKNILLAENALRDAASITGNFTVKSEMGSMSVCKLTITPKGGSPVRIDLTNSEEFGMMNAKTTNKSGIEVIDLVETLLSLYLKRNYKELTAKDDFAARALIASHKEYLNSPEAIRVINEKGKKVLGFAEFIKERMDSPSFNSSSKSLDSLSNNTESKHEIGW